MNICARGFALLAVTAFLVWPAGGQDVPNDIIVQAILKPEGNRLRLLVRVPMNAIRGVPFPERGRGYLDLEKAEPMLPAAAQVWVADYITVVEDDVPLPNPSVVSVRVSLESDKSFASYGQALAHVTGQKLAPETDVAWRQTMLDILLEYPIRSDRSEFSVRLGFARLGVRVATGLRAILPDGVERAFEFTGDPGLVRLDPRWFHAASRFASDGFWHILNGTDHLLFLFCLVIPFRSVGTFVPIVTGFTVAHSITLIASALGFAPTVLWFSPLIETLIAVSILYMALENIVGHGSLQKRWMMAFGFGLIHGFGFSFALRQTMQFGGSHPITSLLSFNVGIEIGQFIVLAALIPALMALFRFVIAERLGTIILSALAAHTAWHWMVERWTQLIQFRFEWPAFDALWWAGALRYLMAIVVLAGLMWLISLFVGRRSELTSGSVQSKHEG